MSNKSSIREQHNISFTEALEMLNTGQRTAVEQIEGPVLVIAGPGTGKTHILTARIGRILLETDTQAHNILCLTFTDAGVRAMRERLLEFIGPEAHRVHIYTFHSFCNTIIQDNLEIFGRHDLEPMSDLERVEIIRRIIDQLDVDHPQKRGRADIYFYETHLYHLFQHMKSENWEVATILGKIDEYLSDLPNRKEYIYQRQSGPHQKGDLKEARIMEEHGRMDRLRAAVNLFPKYRAFMQQMHRYDYDDMILWVLQAFRDNEALLRTYQEQYLYFLVDEFQDTNGAQNQVLKDLTGYWENPNVFIVGDDDQSIFEFQGARLKNLTDFYEVYRKELQLVLLRENYRSSQHILDTSRALIGHNELRIVNSLKELGIEKLLRANHGEFAQSKVRPQLTAYPNRMHEEAAIAEQIGQMWQSGFPLHEVAVIYARHKQAANLIELLEKRGIPYQTRRKVNILHLPLIINLRTLLEYIDLETQRPHSGEHLLFKLLHFSFLNVSLLDVATLSRFMALTAWRERPPWRVLLKDASRLKDLNLQAPEAILQVSELIEQWMISSRQLSLPGFLEQVINRSGLLAYVLEQPDRNWQIQVLKSFTDFVRQECERSPRLDLPQLIELFGRMDANRLSIAVNKEIYDEQGVQLITAHSAKGLEFQRVFVIDCVKDYWEPKKRGNSFRFPLPDTLTYSGEEDALEARRRLFYVAMTRAKEQLYLSYSLLDQRGKDLQRALFIEEIAQSTGLKETLHVVPEKALLEAQVLYLKESERPRLPAQNKAQIDALLSGFSLSISSLNSYLYCPLGFFYEHVLRAPVQESEAAAYGSAVHNALQRIFERMLRDQEKQFPSRDEFVKLFEFEMMSRRGQFSPATYQRRLEAGRRYLAAYYGHYHPQWPQQVRIEQTIRNVEIDGVPVTGTIDRLELLEQLQARIVDYKTGVPKEDRVRRPTISNPDGGPYWRQLVFYKLLFEHTETSSRKAIAGVISYIEPDANGNLVEKQVDYRPKDVQVVRKLIRESYDSIQQHAFTEGCGKDNCQWCNFVRRNLAVDSFANEELEALDD